MTNQILPPGKVASLAMLFASIPFSGFSQELERDEKEDLKKSRTTIQEQGGRKVTITQLPVEEGKIFRKELARIAEAKKQALAQQAQHRSLAQKTEEPLIQKSFVVSAMILPDHTTFLKCWSTNGGQVITGHSNCNWNHFMGQQTFQDGNVQYSFILLPSNAPRSDEGSKKDHDNQNNTLKSAPEGLPSILESGAKYMVMEGHGNEEILDFLESVHQRYDREKRTLIRTFRSKRRDAEEKERQLRTNPPKPQDVVIRFGRIEEPSSESPQSTKKDQ